MKKGKQEKKKPELKNCVDNLKNLFSELIQILSDILDIKCSTEMISFALSQTYLKNAETINKMISQIGKLNEALSNDDLFTSLRRRIAQQTQNSEKGFYRGESELLQFFCENDARRQWADVIDDIISFENGREKQCLSTTDLKHIVADISENIVIDIDSLEIKLSDVQLKFLTRFLPVIYAFRNSSNYFINLHEYIYTPGAFEALMFSESIEEEADERQLISQQTENS